MRWLMRPTALAGLMLIWFAASGMALATVEVYDFSTEEGYARYQELTFELRCPKCQNQNIADSNAEIARDLRKEVHRLIEEGESNREIVDYMVARYGDFVRYKPPFNATTFALWTAPVVLALAGIGGIFWWGRRRRRMLPADNSTLTADEQQRLNDLLGRPALQSDPVDK